LSSESDLKDFTLGFTQAKASFDFVDVGHGKERADNKVRGKFRCGDCEFLFFLQVLMQKRSF
jgi:hypothetical protein